MHLKLVAIAATFLMIANVSSYYEDPYKPELRCYETDLVEHCKRRFSIAFQRIFWLAQAKAEIKVGHLLYKLLTMVLKSIPNQQRELRNELITYLSTLSNYVNALTSTKDDVSFIQPLVLSRNPTPVHLIRLIKHIEPIYKANVDQFEPSLNEYGVEMLHELRNAWRILAGKLRNKDKQAYPQYMEILEEFNNPKLNPEIAHKANLLKRIIEFLESNYIKLPHSLFFAM